MVADQSSLTARTVDVTTRHPATQEAIERLKFDHHKGVAREVGALFYFNALGLLPAVPDCPDLTDALRKLWEAKNAAVYAVIRRQQTAEACTCGAPGGVGVTHRQDGPCVVVGTES